MDYKTLSVKTFIEDMNGKEVMMKTVPSLTKYPLKLFYKKTVGDIVDLVRSKKLVPEDAIQGRRGALSYLICNRSPAGRQGIVFLPVLVYITFDLHKKRKSGLTICLTGGTK